MSLPRSRWLVSDIARKSAKSLEQVREVFNDKSAIKRSCRVVSHCCNVIWIFVSTKPSVGVADERRRLRWSVRVWTDLWDNSATPTAVPAVRSYKLGSRRQRCKVQPRAAAEGRHILHSQRTGRSAIPDGEGAAIHSEGEEQRPRREGTCRLHHEPCRWQQLRFHFQVSNQQQTWVTLFFDIKTSFGLKLSLTSISLETWSDVGVPFYL